jgi:hypothetical protein
LHDPGLETFELVFEVYQVLQRRPRFVAVGPMDVYLPNTVTSSAVVKVSHHGTIVIFFVVKLVF